MKQSVHRSSCSWILAQATLDLIRFIKVKSYWMKPCVKTQGKCNESVNNESKIMRKRDS